MLIATYDPAAQATCPTCKKVVDCLNTGGLLFGDSKYMDFSHEQCGTRWRNYIDENRVEITSTRHLGD